jgi:hypothetical protein
MIQEILRPTRREARWDYPGLDPEYYWVKADDQWHGPYCRWAEVIARFPEAETACM